MLVKKTSKLLQIFLFRLQKFKTFKTKHTITQTND